MLLATLTCLWLFQVSAQVWQQYRPWLRFCYCSLNIKRTAGLFALLKYNINFKWIRGVRWSFYNIIMNTLLYYTYYIIHYYKKKHNFVWTVIPKLNQIYIRRYQSISNYIIILTSIPIISKVSVFLSKFSFSFSSFVKLIT